MKTFYVVAFNIGDGMRLNRVEDSKEALKYYRLVREKYPQAIVEIRYHKEGKEDFWKVVLHANRGY